MSRHAKQRDQLLEHALAYAEAGWSVFPLRPGTKRPATPNHTAEHCDQSDQRCWNGHVGWEARATLDADRITKAWQMRPYGIAIACGPAGLIIVDLDTAKGTAASGADTLVQLEHNHGQSLPATWTVATPSGGRHLYYRQPDGQRLGNTAGKAGPGIDTRAHGGYVVAPPTTTPTGDYWLVDDHPPTELPDWLAHLLTTPSRPERTHPTRRNDEPQLRSIAPTDRIRRYAQRAISGELDRIRTAPEGERNHRLFYASIALGQLTAAGLLDQHQAEQFLLDAAAGHVAAGAYSHYQAQQTITSGLSRGLDEPRQLPADLTSGAAS